MAGFLDLVRRNRNYRYTWLGQIVSEVGDHFNTVAVFSLALSNTGSGLVVSGLMISRALPMILAGPLAGVLLDRMDRKRLMIASDLLRAVVAALFVLATGPERTWLLYLLSALLVFASPFFTSGRAAILPAITTPEELHTANSLTKTTQWTALTAGAMLGGAAAMKFGYEGAFAFNALSFLFSAACIARLQTSQGFRPALPALTESQVLRPWRDYIEGLTYMRSAPLLLAIGLVHLGWASGGGAAQVLFALFGQVVYPYGPAGMGTIWGFAGLGLLAGGALANLIGDRLSFDRLKSVITVCFAVHGLAYIAFSQARPFWLSLFFIALSRAGMGVTAILNTTLLLRHVPDAYRGRVLATIESLVWGVMMVSMAAAGYASGYWDPRTIGAAAGMLSSSTALIWLAADRKGWLVEPPPVGIERQEVEVHDHPAV
jgi:MFS family permease